MQLLVGTHTGLYLVDIDLKSESATLSVINYGYYYGIAVWEDCFLAARRMLCLSKESPTTFEMYSNDFEFLSIPPIEGGTIVDVHQIAAGEHGIYITNSANRRLEFINTETEEKSSLIFTADAEVDFRINSVEVSDDNIFICRHNRDIKPSEIYHLKHDGETWVMCTRYPIVDEEVHNMIYSEGWLLYNASAEGKIKAVYLPSYYTDDWEKKNKIKTYELLVEDGSYTKGMAAKDGILYIGVSEKTDTMERFSSLSSIALVSVKENKVLGTLPLRQTNGLPIGNINEIRILP
jgi:hypothetical protein